MNEHAAFKRVRRGQEEEEGRGGRGEEVGEEWWSSPKIFEKEKIDITFSKLNKYNKIEQIK